MEQYTEDAEYQSCAAENNKLSMHLTCTSLDRLIISSHLELSMQTIQAELTCIGMMPVQMNSLLPQVPTFTSQSSTIHSRKYAITPDLNHNCSSMKVFADNSVNRQSQMTHCRHVTIIRTIRTSAML